MPAAGKRQIAAAMGAMALFIAAFALLLYSEPVPERLYFALATTTVIAAFVALLSRRLLLAAIVALALIAAILVVSIEKRATMNVGLHSYDLFFYINEGTLKFLWSDYRACVLWVLATVATGIAAGVFAWRLEGPRPLRPAAFLVLIAALSMMAVFEHKAKDQAGAFRMMTEEHSYVSAFYLSWEETWNTVMRGQLVEAAARTTLPNFGSTARCTPRAKPPHIMLIHQESLVPPVLFPHLNYDHDLDRFFVSEDGKLHRLRVETYGGGSWVTEFALLSGISTKAFGDMQMFVQVLMQDRLKESLPQSLENCGYRTLMLFPMDKTFLSLDRFYRSIGFGEILDRKAQGAEMVRERDRFYFGNALAEMERHFGASDRPMFVYVQTMASHGPYNDVYMPEENVPGGGPGTSGEMSEFLRRTAMAERDGDFLIAELKRRFPDEKFLVVRYGDHQPSATYDLIDKVWGDDAPDVGEGGKPGPYITYYTMQGLNYAVPTLPNFDPLDVAYLGTVIKESAGLPLSEVELERKRLMVSCRGRYSGCNPRSEILAFHRRLISSGLVRTQ
jgi:phosphoglycerol transferase MdoB-like AlkP superfamily enzyme